MIASHESAIRCRVCWRCAALLLLVAGLFPVAGTAQDERVTVRVDGRSIFRVGSAGEQAAAERAERIERRLATLLENPEAIAPSRIERSGADGSERTISVAGVPVVTVTQLDAEDNLTTVDALASQWQAALDGGLERAGTAALRLGTLHG